MGESAAPAAALDKHAGLGEYTKKLSPSGKVCHLTAALDEHASLANAPRNLRHLAKFAAYDYIQLP